MNLSTLLKDKNKELRDIATDNTVRFMRFLDFKQFEFTLIENIKKEIDCKSSKDSRILTHSKIYLIDKTKNIQDVRHQFNPNIQILLKQIESSFNLSGYGDINASFGYINDEYILIDIELLEDDF